MIAFESVLLSLLAGFAPSPLDVDLYGETFSMVFDLDDGTYVLLQMAVTNMGPGDRNGICRYIHVPAGGAAETDGKTYDAAEWKVEGSRFTIGPCTLDEGEAVRMSVVVGEMSIEAGLSARAKGVAPPNHGAKTADGFYEMEVLVPSAAAEVQISSRGSTKRLAGRGFMIHSRSTDTPGAIARRWARFRATGEGRVHLAQIRFPADGGAPSGWSWAPPGDPSPVTEAKVGSKPGPEFMVVAKTASGPWRIRTRKLLYRDAPLERHGWLGTLLGKVLGNPVTHHFRAELAAPKGVVPGILEISQIE